MAEQVNIASLTIDADDVIKESVRLKKELDALKKSQKELKDSGQDTSEAFVQNEIQIKKLSKSYRDNQNFATALDKANEDLTQTMKVQGKSTQQLRDSRSQLNQISKNIIGDTEEEIALREELNVVINEQTEALKEQAPEYIEQKENIGAVSFGFYFNARRDRIRCYCGRVSVD
jgi:chromosome segregation ATPase